MQHLGVMHFEYEYRITMKSTKELNPWCDYYVYSTMKIVKNLRCDYCV